MMDDSPGGPGEPRSPFGPPDPGQKYRDGGILSGPVPRSNPYITWRPMPPARPPGSHGTFCSCRPCCPLLPLLPFEPLCPLQSRLTLLQGMAGRHCSLSTLASGQCIGSKHEARWPRGSRRTLPTNGSFLPLQPWPAICSWHPWYSIAS